jgi:hypothetical protein
MHLQKLAMKSRTTCKATGPVPLVRWEEPASAADRPY